MLQRCSRPLCSSQGTGGATTRSHALTGHPVEQGVRQFAGGVAHRESRLTRSLRTQQCAWNAGSRLLEVPRRPPPKLRVDDSTDERLRASRPNSRRSTSELVCRGTHVLETGRWTAERIAGCQVLLRKEVIQPHLPVRLPCYDFVPIASPTFDGSLHKGWATGFGCCRLS